MTAEGSNPRARAVLTSDSPITGTRPDMTDAEMDKMMKEFATDAVGVAAERSVVLDYSEESLVLVDRLLGREWFIGRTPRTPESESDRKLLRSCAEEFGAYVGEVVLRTMGGKWVADPTSTGGVQPAVLVDGARGFPVTKVWKRLTESESDTLSGYCRALRFVLERQAEERSKRGKPVDPGTG